MTERQPLILIVEDEAEIARILEDYSAPAHRTRWLDSGEQAVETVREEQPDLVENIINEGCERARDVARETMDEVRHAMSLS